MRCNAGPSVHLRWNISSHPPQVEVVSLAADGTELHTSITCELSPQKHRLLCESGPSPRPVSSQRRLARRVFIPL